MRTETKKCSKCGNEFLLEIIHSMPEATRMWHTYYSCPHCGALTNITLNKDEDVRTLKIEQKIEKSNNKN